MLDIFKSNAFSLTSLVAAIEKIPFQPQRLGELGIFESVPSMTKSVSIEERSGVLSLLPLSQRGAPLGQRTTEKRKIRDFGCRRIAKQDVIMADELLGVRAFGSEIDMVSAQAEVARRFAGPTGLLRDIELTWEYMRLAAIQGLFVDPADASTVYNYFTEFSISPNSVAYLDLAAAAPDPGELRKNITAIVRTVLRKLQGGGGPSVRIHALCSDTFWDALTSHVEVRQTFINWNAAVELRSGNAFGAMSFGGIDWENYRGTDDGSTVTVPTDTALIFPVGAPGMFQTVWAPSEFLEDVGQRGRPVTPKVIPDLERNAKVTIEAYSYPLFLCTRPGALVTASKAAS